MTRLRVPWQMYAGALAMLVAGGTAIVAAYPSQRLLGAMFEADLKLDEALVYYRAWAESHPRDYDARWHTASLELAGARPTDAIATLETMANDWPGDQAVLEKLVDIEDSLLRVRDVIPRLDAIAERYPDDFKTLRRLADHHRWFGNTDALLDALERIAVHDQAVEERIELADILLANRDYQRLIDIFSANPVTTTVPEADPRIFVAEAQKRMDKPEQASETLLALLAHHPNHSDALAEIASIWLDRNRPDMAEIYFARATMIPEAKRQQVAASMFATASADAAERGDRERAIALGLRRIALEPESIEARLAFADLYDQEADAVAVVQLRELSERLPESTEVWRLLAQRLQWRNDAQGALEALDKAVSLAPEDLDTRRDLARVLRDSGRIQAAIGEYRRIAGETGNHDDFSELFDVLFAEGHYSAAVSMSDHLRRPTPAQRKNLALAMAWGGNCANAIGALRELSTNRATDDQLWRARRDCAIELGDPNDALLASSHLRRAKQTRTQP